MISECAYCFTRHDSENLNRILEYISCELKNPQTAGKFMDDLTTAISRIRILPESGPLLMNEFIPEMNIRKQIIGNYIMYYRFRADEEMIIIERILSERQNIDELIEELR